MQKLRDYFLPCPSKFRSSHPEVFRGKDVLKICSKFTGEHPCRSAISIKLLCNLYFSMGVLLFRTSFPRSTYGWLLLEYLSSLCSSGPERLDKSLVTKRLDTAILKLIAMESRMLPTGYIQHFAFRFRYFLERSHIVFLNFVHVVNLKFSGSP